MVSVQLDDDLVAVIPQYGEPIDRLARELIVLELYRRDAISGGKAAELLGMSRLEFIRYSGRLGVPYGNMTAEDWEAELRTLDEPTNG